MTLNEIRDEAFENAEEHGFHEKPINFGERLMLIVSELSEALEADRRDDWYMKNKQCPVGQGFSPENIGVSNIYKMHVKGTVEEELADAIIRIGTLAGIYKIDLDWHVKAKMAYNKTRPYKHGKQYG